MSVWCTPWTTVLAPYVGEIARAAAPTPVEVVVVPIRIDWRSCVAMGQRCGLLAVRSQCIANPTEPISGVIMSRLNIFNHLVRRARTCGNTQTNRDEHSDAHPPHAIRHPTADIWQWNCGGPACAAISENQPHPLHCAAPHGPAIQDKKELASGCLRRNCATSSHFHSK